MENKTKTLHNTPVMGTGIESDHQHNTPPQYLRYVQQQQQQSLKIPNAINNQQRHSPMVIHQHMHPPYQQPSSLHKHQIQYNSHSNSPNIHANPLHLHYNNQYIYQQNKLIQQQISQPIYQTNQSLSAYASHNSIIQSSPQPWVPVHANLIYQNQPKTISEPLTPVTVTSTSSATTTPVHVPSKSRELERFERKKSASGHHQQLRSPSAKRPTDTPVTLQGWLHKQGSDGLMLWKKRWFVLTEYVLFYYKGSEEEKLLGSILLPSYRVSLCGHDDKVNRKYAFKCEHTNMRTYVLAADSHELMMQWIRVLNLACMLQTHTNVESDSSPSTYNNQVTHANNENSESNYSHQNQIHQQMMRHQQHSQPQPQQQQQPQLRMPLHVHSSSNTTDFSNPSQDLSQYNQPLYANAPPKPRRLNDTGYSSPSPEMLDRYNEPKYVTLQTPPYNVRGPAMSKSNSVYSNQEYNYQEYAPHHQGYIIHQNTERRTPDTYGRSKSNMAPNGRHPSDYEDIYAEQFMYKRPLSPLAYNKSIALATPIQRSYTPMSIAPREAPQVAVHKSPNSIPRPHSADFLEYEMTHRHNSSMNVQPARPKSSLDINRNGPGDNYFYSEESYAEKMRKSAQYLSKYAKPARGSGDQQERQLERQQERQQHHQDNTFPLMRSSTQPLHYANAPIEYASVRKELQQRTTRCRSVLSEGSISKEIDMDLCTSPTYKDALMHQQDHSYQQYDLREYDPFTRSASARLANIEQRLQGDGRAGMNKEGERKREESMKRLLEWKQRMLQSPLNRKMNQAVVNKAYGKSEYYNKRNNSYTSQMDPRLGMGHHQYNSYSSDDEENADGASIENKTMQAGRTSDTKSSTDTTAPYTSISLLAPQTDTPLTVSVNLSHDNDKLSTAQAKPFNPNENENENNEPSTTPSTTTNFAQKGNGALVKSILAEFAKKSSGDTANDNKPIESPTTPMFDIDIDAVIEENYMTMTPKKNAFDFGRISEDLCEMEENPYVEMTQGITTSILDPHAQQSYELVNFAEGHMEPLYMELYNHQTKRTNDLTHHVNDNDDVIENQDEKKTELPDILLPVQLSKSDDSSDADDEASKDLESLYATNPRFSLSDNFRPASYYLGASQSALPEQDSSDSEIVSPPPIPRSPPPLDELGKPINKSDTNKDADGHSLCSDLGVSRLSQNSDSDIEFRKDMQTLFKRRPVSDDYRDELESLDSDFNKTDINTYLKLFENNRYHDYENMLVANFGQSPILHSRELSRDSQNTATYRSDSEIGEVPDLGDESKRLETAFLGDKSSSASFSICDKMDNSDEFNTSMNSAPYYYSDLGMNTQAICGGTILKLNNQRGTMHNGKRDIMHIVNPIRCNNNLRQMAHDLGMDQQYKLANEARSVSVDFINLTDKSGQIDKKNVYESDTLKRLKVAESVATSFQSNPEMRNVYHPSKRLKDDKFLSNYASNETNMVRRSHSLEGLLENVLNDNGTGTLTNETNTEGSYVWEEDSIWRERLRNASQRHTRSLDDLDSIGTTPKVAKKTTRAITRDVVYVNDNVQVAPKQSAGNNVAMGGRRRGGKENFTLDREKLRQWDLMSSAPSDSQPVEVCSRANTEIDYSGDRNRTTHAVAQAQDAASGSVSMNVRDTFPRNNIPHHHQQQQHNYHLNNQSRSTSNLNRSLDSEYGIWQDYYLSRAPSQQNIEMENRKMQWNEKLKLSAGDLLGRTHEELVLLLIQLRRRNTNISHAIEMCYNEIDSIQAQIHLMDAAKRLESLQKLEQIKQHLLDLEKQYEKGKPMVNLVDNMVKLGSLYRFPNNSEQISSYSTREKMEFNQQMQEKKLLDEERRDWNRVNSNHIQLQEKVQQLYELDQLIHEGSGTLQGLQQDKEEIERALNGIRNRLMQGYNDPEMVAKAQKQQAILENELSRVHLMLAQNSQQLEETVAGNARLEQELLVLKQKLQVSKQSRSSPQFSNAGDSLPCSIGTSAMLESDLQKVQQKVGDLQKQRQELSMQVRQLTDRSNLQHPIKTFSPTQQDGKKRIQSCLWRETDLDTMNIIDHGDQWASNSSIPSSIQSTTQLYIKTSGTEENIYGRNQMDEDAQQQPSMQQEKPEIKTVRIVKRESERRHRDREKITPSKYDALAEDDIYYSSSSPSRNQALQPVQKAQSSTHLSMNYHDEDNMSRTSSTPSIPQIEKETASPVLSPVFKSEAARQIITEMAQETPRQTNRRAVPKEKRRHHTAPHNNLIMKSFNHLPTDDETFNSVMLETRRARDDLDMERALRQRIDAPDVVRSTLSNKELKYNENTIDNILGTPNKIFIPERYIPEQLPQLSAEEEEHRLRKVESIKKMLSADSTILSTSSANLAGDDQGESATSSNGVGGHKPSNKMIEEKKQREHLLQLNQILAKQVMEMSKIVAVKALAKLPLDSSQPANSDDDDDDQSPISPLPLYQQRHNFYS